jgi:DNA-binding NarL/FixJ family response regulator
VAAVLFLTNDLMFSSRVGAAAKAAGASLQLVPRAATIPEVLTADCRLVLVDLSLDELNLPAVVRAVRARAPAARVIAFGPHVDHAALADASDAGCDQVLSRGQFNQEHPALLQAAATS